MAPELARGLTGGLHVEVSPGPPGAETVVLSNSLGTTLEAWDAVVPRLSERLRVVRYDTRGHGRSATPRSALDPSDRPWTVADLADDLVHVLDGLGVARAHVVGLSLGGMTGLSLAARHPERVGRLVVMCTSARLGPEEAWRRRAADVRAGGMRAVSDAVVGRWFTTGFQQRRPDAVAGALRMLEASPAEGYAACCDLIAGLDLRRDLAAVAADTLVLAGAEDRATPVAHLAAIADGVRASRLEVLPDCAHLAPLERPEAVADAILGHLLP